MFDWLRRLRQAETPEEAEAALLRAARRIGSPFTPKRPEHAPASFADDAAVATVLFPTDLYPSDGGAPHHAGGAPCDAGYGFGCDGGGSHH